MVSEQFKQLISEIKFGNYSNVKDALDNSKENGCTKSQIVNLKNEDFKTPLHIALEQPNPDLEIIRLLLDKGCDVTSYRYNGPFDQTKSTVEKDSYLHLAARVCNTDAFKYVFKCIIEYNLKNIKARSILLPNNANDENPFHLAASRGVLLPIVREVFNYLDLQVDTLNNKIKKAKEAGNCEDIKSCKEKLKFIKSEKKHIRDSLCGKSALNRRNKTPIGCVENTEVRKEIKEIAGIKDSLICNEKLRLCLYVLGSIVFTMILCLSLYFLYIASQTFALSSMASIAAGGTAFLASKACSELYTLNNNDASIEGVTILSHESLGITPS